MRHTMLRITAKIAHKNYDNRTLHALRLVLLKRAHFVEEYLLVVKKNRKITTNGNVNWEL